LNKILVIGGAGYVGSSLVPLLLENNYEVTVFDLLIYGNNLPKKNNKFNLVKGDIRDIGLLKRFIINFDQVIHLACISNDPSFELNPILGKDINLDCFEPLVKICKDNGVKKFIYASSSSVYGVKPEKDVNENSSLEPLTDYSKFKVKCEEILLKYSSNFFSTVILRPATVCGYSPRQRLDLVVNILFTQAYINNRIVVYGGDQLRPNIHILDMIRAYLLILKIDSKKVNNKIFNIGFENHSVKNIANIAKEIVGDNVTIEFRKSDDNRSYHISSKRIKDELGFFNKKTIKDAMIDLKNAFEKKIIKNPLNNEFYYNIKRMQSIKLK
jgi:nucleoside-diphosphate-sugar epimerase